jgi:hypothetical protein
MAATFPRFGKSMASDRALVEMAKTMDLNAIAEKTVRNPKSILKAAKRLCVPIKGWKANGK